MIPDSVDEMIEQAGDPAIEYLMRECPTMDREYAASRALQARKQRIPLEAIPERERVSDALFDAYQELTDLTYDLADRGTGALYGDPREEFREVAAGYRKAADSLERHLVQVEALADG